VDIRSARLDCIGQAQRTGDPRGGRAIGIEELRIDQIERLLGMQAARQRQNRARDQRGVDPAGQARQQGETGMVHRYAAAPFHHRDGTQRS
jgi:hypothetical protein